MLINIQTPASTENQENQGRSLEGPCQEGRRIFFIFFAKLYILQTQQRLAPLISKFSAAAFNVLRQTLIWIKVDQKERACLAD
jgi:hypothetical protein